MQRFHAISFAVALSALETSTAVFVLAPDYPDAAADFRKAIKDVGTHLKDFPLSQVIRGQYARLAERAEAFYGSDWEVMHAMTIEFGKSLETELVSHYFLMIPERRRNLYEQQEPLFGSAVENAFPDAGYDIASAGRCIALDEWTAAIFHLMRVLEHGLHDLAVRLNVPMSASVELENWKNIIDRIEKEITKLEQLPKSSAKSATLQFYSEAASNFRYFKDAWRNHVSHSRATYDERQALNTWNHVRMFMQELATRAA